MNEKFSIKGWLLGLLLLVQLPYVAWADGRKYDYVMRMNRSAMSLVDNKVVVSMQITAIQDVPATQSIVLSPELVDTVTGQKVELPPIFLNGRQQQIYFDRMLKNDYPDALVMRKKKGENLNIDYTRSVKYEPWMDKAVLKLYKQSCACRDMKDRGELTAAEWEKKVAPTINLFPVYVIPPADKSIKVREERGSAFLCFEVNKWDIKPEYMSNPAELQKINNSVNIVKNDSDVTITKMTIEGYASPEGNYPHNVELSVNRTEALKRYLQMSNIGKGINIEASGKGENWDGFIKYLREHDIPQRNRLLDIATSNLSPDEKERKMRSEVSEGYTYALRNVFPSLRCTNYTVIYTVRPFTLEESERVFKVRPINLNLNEIYRLADKYAYDQEEYYAVIRKAYMLYPEDTYINLSMSCYAIKKGEVAEAEEYLKKVKDCPEKTMNEGLVAWLKGDHETAIRLVEEASRRGVKQADEQLKEFRKLKN